MSIFEVLDDVRETREANDRIVPVLLEGLMSTRSIDPPGPDTWFSISKVPTLCPRTMVIAQRLNVPLVDASDAQARWRMDKGSALHSVLQEMWLGPQKLLLGGWRCPRCGHVHGAAEGATPPFWVADPGAWVTPQSSVLLPDVCEKCGLKWHPMNRFHYVEPWVVSTDLLIRGRTDGLLRLPAHYAEFLDIKTTASLQGVRYAPRSTDAAQLQLYMGLSECRRGRLLYVNPGMKDVQDAMVEHRVDFDPKLMHEEKEKVRGLREALKDKTKPIPRCPYGGKLPFGDCTCVEAAKLWASYGGRARA
jgi:hypothetical protein